MTLREWIREISVATQSSLRQLRACLRFFIHFRVSDLTHLVFVVMTLFAQSGDEPRGGGEEVRERERVKERAGGEKVREREKDREGEGKRERKILSNPEGQINV